MSGLSDSNHETSPTGPHQDVQVQEVPPYMGLALDVDTVSAAAMNLSDADRVALLWTVYNSVEDLLLAEPKQHPYMQLRFQQARTTFYIAAGSATLSLISCAVYTALLITGTLPTSFTIASGIVTSTSGAVSLYCYRFYRDANNRLDHAQSLYKMGDFSIFKTSEDINHRG